MYRLKPSSEPLIAWALTSGNGGIESRQDVLDRVRRKIKAAKARTGKSWQELFALCDENKNGTLCPAEMKILIRHVLSVPIQTVCEQELKTLMSEIDKNGDSQMDIAELFEYIQHGPRHKQTEDLRLEQRVTRVRRNLQLAFQNFSTQEADVRKLFQKMDMDDSNRCSFYEFEVFVRKELKLSKWDVLNNDLYDFYMFLDKDGDGIDWSELRDFLKLAQSNRATVGGQNFFKPQGMPTRRKRKTYKEGLEADMSLIQRTEPRIGLPFANLGRDSRPTSRASACMPQPEKPTSAGGPGFGILDLRQKTLGSSASAPSLRY